jgi:hypothetical protein
MDNILIHAHSVWRWVVLILLLTAIFKAFSGWRGKKEFTAGDKKLAMFAMISFHIQFLIGWILYFVSQKGAAMLSQEGFMKFAPARFNAMEHPLMMTIAMIVITIGYGKPKRLTQANGKFKKIFVFYLITLLIVLAAIPWPFRTALGGGWF